MGAEMIDDYPYTPLDISTPSIRLLRVQPDGHGSMTGWLEAFSLGDPKCPAYNTRLYLWGQQYKAAEITLVQHNPVLHGRQESIEKRYTTCHAAQVNFWRLKLACAILRAWQLETRHKENIPLEMPI